MKKYKTIIFDLDGTLLNPKQGILKSVIGTIEQLGLEQLPEETINEFIGPPIQVSFQKYYNKTSEQAQAMAEIFRDLYKNKYLYDAVVYDGIIELLSTLKQRYKLAIATYKREDYAIDLLKYFNLAEYFDIIYGGDNNNKLTKQDIILKCVDYLSCEPSECVMIGDTKSDGIAAKNLGLDFIAVTYGFGFKNKNDIEETTPIVTCCNCNNISEFLLDSSIHIT